jgi:hypothetical protein
MHKPKAPRLVTVAITTTITIIFWIFLTLYRVLTTKPAPSVDPILLAPIDATLDVESLEKIKGRVFFEEGSFTAPVLTPDENSRNDIDLVNPPTETPAPEDIEPAEEETTEEIPEGIPEEISQP